MLKARVSASYSGKLVRSFGGHEYVDYEWRRVPADVPASEIEYLEELGLLEFDYPETQAPESDQLESLRRIAKEAGIAHYWNKKTDTLLADLSALDEEE